MRYGLFVGAGLLVMSVTLVIPSVAIFTTLGACEQDSVCTSLENDLQSSRDHSVHPCEDFYEHVCRGWDRQPNKKYIVPYIKYEMPFNKRRIQNLFQVRIPEQPRTSEHKAALLLLRCLSQQSSCRSVDLLTSYLRRLNLPWPHKSPASRQQLLEIMVQASLEFGLPAVWAFHVGRNPKFPAENTLFLDLAERLGPFFGTTEALVAIGTAENFLRLCAEMIGGTGQSYSSMIDDVLAVHQKFTKLTPKFYNVLGIPTYMSMNDEQLRRAVNGQLPDNSQLWRDDKIVNLQLAWFEQFDKEFLQTPQERERFKLYLGAYIVWDLSPLMSRHLTSQLMEALKNVRFTDDYAVDRCLWAVNLVMPMASWKAQDGLVYDKAPVFRAMKLTKQGLERYGLKFSEKAKSLISNEIEHVFINALNSTLTSALVDEAYSFMTVSRSGHFFNTFLEVSSSSMSFFKESLRKPQHGIVYIMGIAQNEIYRMLVAREATVPSFFQVPPLLLEDTPSQVIAAVVGTRVSSAVLMLIDLVFFHDKGFR
ncbi:unnamed protein product, partial [Ixodes persulcatus]